MSLIGNGGFWLATPGRQIGGSPFGYLGAEKRGAFNNLTANVARFLGATFSNKSAMPPGYTPGQGAWVMPMVGGDIASRFEIAGVGSQADANLAGGLNGEAALAGTSDLTAVGQLILSAVATLSGLGGLTADITGKLDMAADLTAQGSFSAALSALADAVASIVGTGSLAVTARADGMMAAEITPFTDLSPQTLAASVWNSLVNDFQEPGTMGLLLGEAGGGSSPSTIADAVWDEAPSTHTTADTFGALVQEDVYTAKVLLLDDNAGTVDRYVVSWFKNGSVVLTGVTSPTIRVVKVSDGADLVPVTAMTEVGLLSRFRYDASAAERIAAGSAYLAIASATIGGAARSWDQPVGRDSA